MTQFEKSESFEKSEIKVGISGCLMGQKVRFDGGHKQSKYCRHELSNYFSFQPVCPEMGIGMGAPRKTIRMVKTDAGDIRVKASDDSFDVTDKLTAFSAKQSESMHRLSGFILCAKSPTCGTNRVSLYKDGTNHATQDGVGIFAARIMADHPLMPVEDQGRLNDPVLRENFITRVYAWHDWKGLVSEGITRKALFEFHARYKYLLMAHSPAAYKALGPLLGQCDAEAETIAEQYIQTFMTTLSQPIKRKGHANTLQHIQGYLKRKLSSPERQQLADSIHKYREGLLPLLAPLTLLKHYLSVYPDKYIASQVYLNPHPEALRLRMDI